MTETICNAAVPLLVLLALPAGALAFRLGALGSPVVRAALAILVLAILWLKAPPEGFPQESLDRVKLVFAVALTLFAATRSRLPAEARSFFVVLAALVGVLLHYNVFAFHGRGSFVHVHDLAHYYLGSKYAPEIGYGELYAAVARCESEIHPTGLPVDHVRDLIGGGIVPIAGAIEQGARIAERFAPQRWWSFCFDVEALHQWMGPRFAAFLNDHGYNPTPVWSLIGGAIANRVPAGSRDGMRALALIDPLLLAVGFAAVGAAFGLEIACLAVAYYGVLYGAIFDWAGGAFMRNLWFVAVLFAAALWQRGRDAGAGACLALAAMLRVFPAGLLVAPAAVVAAGLIRRAAPERRDLRLVVAFAATATGLFVATLVFGGGIGAWLGFRANLAAHTETLSSNFVGLPAWMRYFVLGVGFGGEVVVEQLFAETGALYRLFAGLLLIGSALLATRLGLRTADPATKLALGLFPIVFGLRLAHYYSIGLVILVLAHRSRDDRLAMLFAAEAILYGLALFEMHFSVLCLYRGVVVAYLLIALWFDEIRDELMSWRPQRRAAAPVGAS